MVDHALRPLLLVLALLGAFVTWPSRADQAAAANAGAVEDPNGARVIVKYKALGGLMRGLRAGSGRPAGPQFATTMSARHGLALRDGRIVEGRTQVLHGGSDMSSAALAARLAADAEVEYAVPDYRRFALTTPDDPLYAANASHSPAAGQWYLQAPDATLVSAIDAPAAWALTTGSTAIVVADIDTGVRFDHPDLVNKLYAGYDFVSTTTTAGDGSGRDSDASDPGDWTSAGECGRGTSASSSSWHGTKTAGLIGAQTGNAIGMASIGHDVMVLPARALGKCGGSDSDIIAAMLWAGGVSSSPTSNPHPARVINLSLGGSGACTAAYADAISQLTAAGVVVVVAAGNSEGLAVSTPGNCAGVITVTGVRHVGTKVGFASVGPEVAIAAPGGNCVNTSGACLYPILTTSNTGTTSPVAATYSDSTNYSVGTSFATPLVAGTAALMLSANPSLTPAQVKSLIQSSARAFPTSSSDSSVLQCHAPNGVVQDECLCTTSTCGAGMLDAGAAVAAAAASATPVAAISASATTTLAGSSVRFDGSASTVPSGRTVASYRWAITSGSAVAAISGVSNAATLTVATSGVGSFTVSLTVTDSAGSSSSASATVTVNAPSGPSVSIQSSADHVVTAGSSVSLDGSASTVASGLSVRAYQWTITSGASLAHFSSATDGAAATVATEGAGSGSFVVRLTVTDSLGQSSSADYAITVTAVVPTVAISASSTTVTAGRSVSLDGSASAAPSGRTIASCQWALTSGSSIAAFSGATNDCASAIVNATAAGSFTVQLTVVDSAGAEASRSVTITATAATVSSDSSSNSGGSAGGGAMSGLWLAALAAATLALGRRSR